MTKNHRSTAEGNRAANLLTSVLVLTAVLTVGLVARREFFPPPDVGAIAAVPDRRVTEWETLLHDGRVLGASGATSPIVKFSDFQCAFCDRVRPELLRLREVDPSRVGVIYRHFVLEEARPAAFAAAMAAECAAEQGRFAEFHDALFAAQDSIGTLPLSAFADRSAMPRLAEFQECVESERFRGRVEADTRAGIELGVVGTPAFVHEGVLYTGISAPARIEPILRRALKAR
jgi:protein-disulfide isomerase